MTCNAYGSLYIDNILTPFLEISEIQDNIPTPGILCNVTIPNYSPSLKAGSVKVEIYDHNENLAALGNAVQVTVKTGNRPRTSFQVASYERHLSRKKIVGQFTGTLRGILLEAIEAGNASVFFQSIIFRAASDTPEIIINKYIDFQLLKEALPDILKASGRNLVYKIPVNQRAIEIIEPSYGGLAPIPVLTIDDLYSTRKIGISNINYQLTPAQASVFRGFGRNGRNYFNNYLGKNKQINPDRLVSRAQDGRDNYPLPETAEEILTIRITTPEGCNFNLIDTYAGNGTFGYSGDGGDRLDAQIPTASGVIEVDGYLYFADNNPFAPVSGAAHIRRINLVTGIVENFAGNDSNTIPTDGSIAINVGLRAIRNLTTDGMSIFCLQNFQLGVPPFTQYRFIAQINIATGILTYFHDFIANPYPGMGAGSIVINDIAYSPITAHIYTAVQSEQVIVEMNGIGGISIIAGILNNPGYDGEDTLAVTSRVSFPLGLAVDSLGNLYFSQRPVLTTDFNLIRVIKITDEKMLTVVGIPFTTDPYNNNQPPLLTPLFNPSGMVFDNDDNLYFIDYGVPVVRQLKNGIVTTIAGQLGLFGYSGDGGDSLAATIHPNIGNRIDISNDNERIYFADGFNFVIRNIDCT